MQLGNAYLITFIKLPTEGLSYESYDWLSILPLVWKNMCSAFSGVTVLSVHDASINWIVPPQKNFGGTSAPLAPLSTPLQQLNKISTLSAWAMCFFKNGMAKACFCVLKIFIYHHSHKW